PLVKSSRRAGTMRVALPVCIPVKCACAAAMVFLGSATEGWADAIEEEDPIPSSIDQSVDAIERAFRPPPPAPVTLYPELRQKLAEAPPFIRDAQIEIYLRNFYRNNTNADQSKSEALAGGGWISIRSGWLADVLSVGSTFYTSQPIYAPQDRDGTQLLDTGQRGYSALGQLYARLKIAQDNYFTAGLYTYDTPYLSRNDIRMTPYTFEGYVLQGSTGGSADGQP